MGIMVYSLLWVMQDFVHQPYESLSPNPNRTPRNMPFKSSRGIPPNVSECCLAAGHLHLGFRLVLAFVRFGILD